MNINEIYSEMKRIGADFILIGMSGAHRGWYFCNLSNQDLHSHQRPEVWYWGSGIGPDIENAFADAVRKYEIDKARERGVARAPLARSSVPSLDLSLEDL